MKKAKISQLGQSETPKRINQSEKRCESKAQINQSDASMSPDSGWSDSYSSDGWSPRRSDSSTSIYDSSTDTSAKYDSSPVSDESSQPGQMSSFIEQAFEMSVGKIETFPPAEMTHPIENNPIKNQMTSSIENQDLGIFDHIFNQPINEHDTQTAPPWEELDIGIDHSQFLF